MTHENLGTRLKRAREAKGMTQSDVCDAIKIPKTQTLSAYERNVNNPPIEILKELSVLYGVSTDTLLFGAENIPQKVKTKFDYIKQLIDAVDNLGLDINSREDWQTHDTIFELQLSQSNLNWNWFNSFLPKWACLRQALEVGALSKENYDAAINQRLAEIGPQMLKEIDSLAETAFTLWNSTEILDDAPF